MNNDDWPPSEGEVRRRLRRDEQDRLTREILELTYEDDTSSDFSWKDSIFRLIQHIRSNHRVYAITIGVLTLLATIIGLFV